MRTLARLSRQRPVDFHACAVGRSGRLQLFVCRTARQPRKIARGAGCANGPAVAVVAGREDIMRNARRFVIAPFALISGCATVDYQGQTAAPKASPAPIVDAQPAQAHHSLGRITVQKVVGETLETMLARLGKEGAKRGCDVVVCNVNNTIVEGVQSNDSTGVSYFSQADGARVPDGLFGEGG